MNIKTNKRMRRRREKGFKKIEIVDSNYDTQIGWFDYINIKCIISLIVFGISLFLIFIIVIYYFSHKTKNAESFYNNLSLSFPNKNNLKNNNITINITSNISNGDNSSNKMTNKITTENKDMYIYNISNFTKEIYEMPNKQLWDGEPLISIIIIATNSEKENIEELLGTIYDQTLKNIEIIILDDNKLDNKNMIIYKKIKENKKKGIKIIEYASKVGKLRKRLDGINNSKSPYILFMDSDDSFSLKNFLETLYNQIKADKVDILEFGYNPRIEGASPIYQPQLFDKMYFEQDSFHSTNNLLLTGKLIKKELLIKVINNIDNFYKAQNMNYYEENMMLYSLYKNAKSYQLLRIKGTSKIYSNHYFGWNNLDSDLIIKDFLLYISYVFKISGNNVPEKRQLASIFINNLVNKRAKLNNIQFNNFFNNTVESFLNCEKISDYDKNRIKEYQDYTFRKIERNVF